MSLPAIYKKNQALHKAMLQVEEFAPDAFPVVESAILQSMAALDENDVFVLRSAQGQIRAFKRKLVLSKENGGLIQPVPGGPFVVSAQGYEIWANATAANVLFMKKVLVRGQWENNPFAEVDPDTGRIIRVYCRAVAFMYNSIGIPVVADWTTTLDQPTYRMIDLIAKSRKYPQAFKVLPKGTEPEVVEDETPRPTWGKYPLDAVMDLWVNSAHPEFLDWYKSILNREKKSLDFGQTFARRNALKHLSGLQSVPGQTGEVRKSHWEIPIICWKPDAGSLVKWDAAEYEFLRDRMEQLIEGAEKDPAAKLIELDQGEEKISDDEIPDLIEDDAEPEPGPIDVNPDPAPEPDAPGLGVKAADNINAGDHVGQSTPPAGELSPKDPAILQSKEYKNLMATIQAYPSESEMAMSEMGLKCSMNFVPESSEQAVQIYEAVRKIVLN